MCLNDRVPRGAGVRRKRRPELDLMTSSRELSTAEPWFVQVSAGEPRWSTVDGSDGGRSLTQLRSLGRSIPRSYMRISSDLIRRIRLRRRWPRPETFDRMSPDQVRSYVQSIGFDDDVRKSLAGYDGGSHQTRLDSGVPKAEGGPHTR